MNAVADVHVGAGIDGSPRDPFVPRGWQSLRQVCLTIDAFRRKLVAHRNAQRVLVSVRRGARLYHVPMPLGGM